MMRMVRKMREMSPKVKTTAATVRHWWMVQVGSGQGALHGGTIDKKVKTRNKIHTKGKLSYSYNQGFCPALMVVDS